MNYSPEDFAALKAPAVKAPTPIEWDRDVDAEAAYKKALANGLLKKAIKLLNSHGGGAYDSASEADFATMAYLQRARLSASENAAVILIHARGDDIAQRHPDVRGYLSTSLSKIYDNGEKPAPMDNPPARTQTEHREALQKAKETVARWLLLNDDRVVDVVLAVPVANTAPGDPVWLIVVAGSSSAKTELVRALSRCPQVFALSTLTDRTFASGFGDPQQSSLLPKLKDGQTLTFKDFGSILSMRPDAKSEVLSQMREIYDGQYRKPFGTGRELEWSGRLGFLTASTPAVERHHGVIGELGERFLWYRLDTPSQDRRAVADTALEDSGQEQRMREEIGQAFLEVIGGVRVDEVAAVTCPPKMRNLIAALADLATWLRTPVSRDYRDKAIDYTPKPEGPGRMAKALLRLGKALAAIKGQDTIDQDVGALLTKVALDSIPPKRVAAARFLAAQDGWTPTRTIALSLDLPTSTTTLLMEDMNALGIADKHGENRYEWRLKPIIASLVAEVSR